MIQSSVVENQCVHCAHDDQCWGTVGARLGLTFDSQLLPACRDDASAESGKMLMWVLVGPASVFELYPEAPSGHVKKKAFRNSYFEIIHAMEQKFITRIVVGRNQKNIH